MDDSAMNLIVAALRHPLTVVVALVAITFGFALAVGKSVCEQVGVTYPAGLPKGMEVDIFPALNLPVIYVCQPYGGMDPAQMEEQMVSLLLRFGVIDAETARRILSPPEED